MTGIWLVANKCFLNGTLTLMLEGIRNPAPQPFSPCVCVCVCVCVCGVCVRKREKEGGKDGEKEGEMVTFLWVEI